MSEQMKDIRCDLENWVMVTMILMTGINGMNIKAIAYL